ncbi:MAG: helix-turn-helix domain-containing protein [Lachnospiraceae bacterium]|nr:helix-turn-helix domain-containing protein [Lachnospiraceae bacterium]
MAEPLTIRELCREHNLTQRALAERFGIPLRTVEDWSTGKRKPPSYVVQMIQTILESKNKE